MKKLLIPLFVLILLSSCAVYTVGQGKANIHVPEVTGEPETRYRVIMERKEWERLSEEERQKAEAAAEAERLEREAEAERLRDEYIRATAVYEYPENIEELTLPHNYRPLREHLSIETENTPLRLLFIPLEPNADLNSVKSSISSLPVDFTFVTGSTEQLVEFSKMMGKDTVLTEGGMVLYNTKVKTIDTDSSSFLLNDEKSIETVILSTYEGLPKSSNEIKDYLPYLEDKTSILEGITTQEDTVIFALSSYEPSSTDWIPFTAYPYRNEHEFKTSTWFEANSYIDIYRTTHYSAETDPGITRENDDIYERMDFIYVKNALPLTSTTFSVAGMDSRAIYAEVLIP